jgi:glycosyltransferase involved in cell wall biosynthesis
LIAVLDRLREPVSTYSFEQEAFSLDGYGGCAKAGDLVFFSWSDPHPLCASRHILSIECGVGYDRKPWGPLRVYESEAWRHYCFGKYDEPLDRRRNSWVIPWAFDPAVWSLGTGSGGYVSYLGRLSPDKGIRTLVALARRLPNTEFRVASTDHECGLGARDAVHDLPKNLVAVGAVYGARRAAFLGNAAAHLCPSEFIEPLCGSAIEAMMCGTPVIASNYGGFTESIVDGLSGFRCATIDEMVDGIENASALSRDVVQAITESGYGLHAAQEKWRKALVQMRVLI